MMTPRPDRFTYPDNHARGGRIVLTTSWMRAVFLVGVVGCAAVALVLAASAV